MQDCSERGTYVSIMATLKNDAPISSSIQLDGKKLPVGEAIDVPNAAILHFGGCDPMQYGESLAI